MHAPAPPPLQPLFAGVLRWRCGRCCRDAAGQDSIVAMQILYFDQGGQKKCMKECEKVECCVGIEWDGNERRCVLRRLRARVRVRACSCG